MIGSALRMLLHLFRLTLRMLRALNVDAIFIPLRHSGTMFVLNRGASLQLQRSSHLMPRCIRVSSGRLHRKSRYCVKQVNDALRCDSRRGYKRDAASSRGSRNALELRHTLERHAQDSVTQRILCKYESPYALKRHISDFSANTTCARYFAR